MIREKSYSTLIKYQTFEERFRYLLLKGSVGIDTFGYDRYLNQMLYTSSEWRRLRDQIIIRDNGCDLGLDDYPINGKVVIHHINPITLDDVLQHSSDIFNPEYLICVSHHTHNAIHYGDDSYAESNILRERQPNDTIPWR